MPLVSTTPDHGLEVEAELRAKLTATRPTGSRWPQAEDDLMAWPIACPVASSRGAVFPCIHRLSLATSATDYCRERS